MSELLKIEADRPSLSLEIPKGTSFEDWVDLGHQLLASDRVLNWWIGDWWNRRKTFRAEQRQQAETIFLKALETCRKCGWVSACFEPVDRRERLTFRHHEEVVALVEKDPTRASALLDAAEVEQWSTRGLRRAVMQARSPSGRRVVDRIDIGAPEPICIDFLTPDEIIVELADALSRERALTERESLFWEKAERRIQQANGERVTEPWSGEQDLSVITGIRAGTRVRDIAAQLERTEDSIWSRVRYLRRKGLLERPVAVPQAVE